MFELMELLSKQEELMKRVPHDIAPHALVKVKVILRLLNTLFRYYNSVGGKPWRPNPLSPIVQQGLLKELDDNLGLLKFVHRTCAGTDLDMGSLGLLPRQYVSGFGVIEESIEYMNSLTDGSGDSHKLEELVDILFFWLEQVAMSGFTMQQITGEYHRKWAVNIKRYEDGARGNYDWDKRGENTL